MANETTKDPEKTVDLPPYGSRNTDAWSDQPGSHPIETGIGAAVGGIASGVAVGAVGGPVGAVIGGIVGGAVGGGLAGKGIGELIDPTTEDNWLREYFGSESDRAAGDTHDTYRSAYRYGLEGSSRHAGKSFDEAESDLRAGWDRYKGDSALSWDRARNAARHAFGRNVQLREEQLRVNKEQVQTGEVGVRKEVHTEHKTVTVPVEREEIVIERRPVGGQQVAGAITDAGTAGEIRIPVKEEQVRVNKEAVVKEEVSVGKRTVHDQKTVSADLKREDLKVDTDGQVKVNGDADRR